MNVLLIGFEIISEITEVETINDKPRTKAPVEALLVRSMLAQPLFAHILNIAVCRVCLPQFQKMICEEDETR